MKQEYKEYWDALGVALGCKETREHIDWKVVEEIAKEQITLPVLYHGLWANGRLGLLPQEIQEEWKEITCVTAIREMSRNADLERVLQAAAEWNIKLICFKGNVIARLYPEWKTRISGDSDIYVYERDKSKAVKLLQDLGYRQYMEDSKEMVPVYVHPFRNHKIELHFSLWEDYEGYQMELLDSMQLTREESLIKIKIGNADAWTLSPTNHLIFQMFHIIKHFVVQGIGTRYMLDITCFVNHHLNELDKDMFWSCMEQLHYTDFCIHYFRLCIKYLNLKQDILPNHDCPDDLEKQDKLLSDMMAFSNREKADYKVITLMSPYLEGRETRSGGSIMRKLRLIFPKPDVLQDDFAYAKKHHILLPIAWVHKWGRFVKNRLTGKSTSAVNKLEEADSRIAIMQEMKLLGDK
ncbi:MAG: nucleotidyltransferase family protein [Lachnospiraceae bacterium]|nr:nucleotidyltransferase family protein [Lachnospiraceae bacterium]